jgi:hypothetical protein
MSTSEEKVDETPVVDGKTDGPPVVDGTPQTQDSIVNAPQDANDNVTENNAVAKDDKEDNNIYFQFDGVNQYTALTPANANKIIEEEKDKSLKTVFTMTRPNANSCFTLKDDNSKPEVESSFFSPFNLFSPKKSDSAKSAKVAPLSGGNIKTKKRRITKKRNQKRIAFKSRSKK